MSEVRVMNETNESDRCSGNWPQQALHCLQISRILTNVLINVNFQCPRQTLHLLLIIKMARLVFCESANELIN